MAGHSKWANIKRKKAKEDGKKSKVFTKIIKEITIAARENGGNPDLNPRLRLLLEKGKEANMPIENAMRAIKKGTGELPGAQYEEYTYEGYAPHGIAVMIDAITDNKNRTVAEFRRLFSENNGSLGELGTVNWMFEKLGAVTAQGKITEDELLEHLIEYDIKDMQIDDNAYTIYCDPKALESVKNAVEKAGLKIENSGLEWVAKNTTELPEGQSDKVLEFLSKVQDHDDVENVYTNLG
ncbi:MAG TPA: YebC/PmpR family DNA-binding transcriptional regulator [Candidatus Babeliales bacterium]|nr:YebC/PmpR family DNA-binding transcriptional regulator [Candidatus Babeliales bacterium]HLC06544.1 YebC/PmpR family DNA-binding transcriptional regulator [Candidatus Babeliales bacterium]